MGWPQQHRSIAFGAWCNSGCHQQGQTWSSVRSVDRPMTGMWLHDLESTGDILWPIFRVWSEVSVGVCGALLASLTESSVLCPGRCAASMQQFLFCRPTLNRYLKSWRPNIICLECSLIARIGIHPLSGWSAQPHQYLDSTVKACSKLSAQVREKHIRSTNRHLTCNYPVGR